MMFSWTKEQLQVIESRKGTILVSAAAGSGKTTVLVERVIQRLEDKDNPCSADRLLIVTFTKAATAQMKEKIASAIEKRLEENPDDEHLLKQRMMLPFAHISTIDSFCGELVRENFQSLGIAPDFKVLDESELDLMRNDAIDKVIEEAYADNSDGFQKLLNLFVSGSNDDKLAEIILSLHTNSRAFPFPDKWLDSLVEPYKNQTEISKSIWGKIIIEYARDMIDYCLSISSDAIGRFIDDDADVAQKYAPVFSSYQKYLEKFNLLLDEGNWDNIRDFIYEFEAGRLSSLPRGYVSSFADRAKSVKSEVSDIIRKKLPKLFCCSENDFCEDIEFLYPAAEKLIELVKSYNREFCAIKAMANGVDFNDIVDYAIRLLVKDVDADGNPVKTKLAQSLSLQFDEILIDEFQDINETQNILFKAISKDEKNLFMVGDVKQSIYRFRQAMPDIFLKRRESLETYIDDNYPAKINLGFNFRSRSGVTGYVNFIFAQLMSKKAGELDYDENEALKPRADYPDKDDADTELHIITDTLNNTGREFEAEYIADYINGAIDSGLMVKDGESQRKVKFSDFCILLRSTKNKADIYSKVLTQKGIPCHVTSRNGFFEATEIKTMLAFMKAIDNPLLDIPLVTTMLSPVFGFTPDELAKLRIDSRNTSYYGCVVNAADNGNKKCAAFINELRRFRTLSATLGAGEFLRELLYSTGYDSLVCAMAGGSQRRANVTLLLDYAEKYEQSGHVGLSGFLRFIERVEKQKGDMEIANEISENADVVRIMSIHKSKGLEFPVCILADCSGDFNKEYVKGNATFHPKYGIGFKRIDGYRRYDTLSQKAVQLATERSERSEELRVLYVALTRAKEKLVCILRQDNPQKKIEKLSSELTSGEKLHPYSVLNAGSISDWLLLSSIRHPDFALSTGVLPSGNLKCDSKLCVKIFEDTLGESVDEEKSESCYEVDESLLTLIKDRLMYEYPYGNLSDIIAKVSPSELESNETTAEHFLRVKPQFLLKDGMNSASKGTAVHKFMEFYDYSYNGDVKAQAIRMVENNKLSKAEEQVLDYPSLSRFFESDIAKEIAASPTVLREKKVTITIPANEIYPDINPNAVDEVIVVQGYIDCAFEKNGKWVVVDYKTDKVDNVEVLRDRYRNQLKMYERALSECTGKEVECTVIYSLHLGQTVIL